MRGLGEGIIEGADEAIYDGIQETDGERGFVMNYIQRSTCREE